jgi:ABC-type uncharacterized transport system involved in gliding motility auxiliary subunit
MRRWERRLALVCGVAGVVALFVAAGLLISEQSLTSGVVNFLIAGVALLIAYAVLDLSAVLALLRDRRAAFGTLSLLITALVLGILVAGNVIVSRNDRSFDLTGARFNTLAPQSVLVAKRLDSDLLAIGFFRPAESSTEMQVGQLLDLYRAQSPHVKVRFLDPDLNSAQLTEWGVRISGTLVLSYHGKTEQLTLGSQSEADITAAILKLESDRSPIVCWVAGEKERDYKEPDRIVGYSFTGDWIVRNNYKLRELLLSQQAQVPADCDMVAIIGPQLPIPESSLKPLQTYLDGGGKLLLAIDPWVDGKTPGAPVVTSVNRILKPYGVSFSDGLVIESDDCCHARGDTTVPVGTRYGQSPVTKDLQGQVTFLPGSTSLGGKPAPDLTVTPLINTSKTSYEIPGPPREDLKRKDSDRPGPFVVMETVEKPLPGHKTRLVLVGTSSFAENRVMPPTISDANPQLLLGSLNWLSEQEGLTSIPPKPSRLLPIGLTARDAGVNIFVTLFLLPILVGTGGVAVWWRRRLTYV